MARRPTRSHAAAAKEAARRDALPLRFTADYPHVTVAKTTFYKAGMVLQVPPDVRKAALAKNKAVVDGE